MIPKFEVDLGKIETEIGRLKSEGKKYWFGFPISIEDSKKIKEYFSEYVVDIKMCHSCNEAEVIIELF